MGNRLAFLHFTGYPFAKEQNQESGEADCIGIGLTETASCLSTVVMIYCLQCYVTAESRTLAP